MTERQAIYRTKGTYTRRRVDGNQRQIVAALRKFGASVFILSSIGHGCPDLLVGYNGRNYLFECKRGDAPLTEDEQRFVERWRGQAMVVRSPDHAMRTLQVLDEDRLIY